MLVLLVFYSKLEWKLIDKKSNLLSPALFCEMNISNVISLFYWSLKLTENHFTTSLFCVIQFLISIRNYVKIFSFQMLFLLLQLDPMLCLNCFLLLTKSSMDPVSMASVGTYLFSCF